MKPYFMALTLLSLSSLMCVDEYPRQLEIDNKKLEHAAGATVSVWATSYREDAEPVAGINENEFRGIGSVPPGKKKIFFLPPGTRSFFVRREDEKVDPRAQAGDERYARRAPLMADGREPSQEEEERTRKRTSPVLYRLGKYKLSTVVTEWEASLDQNVGLFFESLNPNFLPKFED